MKKLTLILICTVLISIQGFSQSFGKKLLQRMEFGVKGGVNYNDFTDANFSTDPLVGFHGGLTVAFKFTDKFMIQEEFLYSTQGAKVLDGALGVQNLKLSYLNVPILLKFRSNLGLYGEIGTQVGLKINEEVANYYGTAFAKKIDFGGIAGLGYQSKMGLGIGARYIYGFQKIPDQTIPNISSELKNNSIQASIFFVF